MDVWTTNLTYAHLDSVFLQFRDFPAAVEATTGGRKKSLDNHALWVEALCES